MRLLIGSPPMPAFVLTPKVASDFVTISVISVYTKLPWKGYILNLYSQLLVKRAAIGHRVTAVNGKYMIGVYTLRKIEFGEELTFDYCCVTEVHDCPYS